MQGRASTSCGLGGIVSCQSRRFLLRRLACRFLLLVLLVLLLCPPLGVLVHSLAFKFLLVVPCGSIVEGQREQKRGTRTE